LSQLSVTETRCKSLLHEMDGLREYTINLYKGCSHGCVYCYAPSLIHDERRWGRFVEVKMNAPEVLARELRKVRKGVVFISSASDPYQPIEAKYRVTRRALEVLLARDFPIAILTRSPLVLRDIDLLRRFSWARVGFSISSVPGRKYEPGVVPIGRRVETMKALHKAGIKTWVSMAPLVSGMMGIDVRQLLLKLKDAGVGSVSTGMLRFQGYPESKALFEEVTGFLASEVSVGADETLASVRAMVDELGFEPRERFFDWKPEGGIEQFFPQGPMVTTN
jgi:DNA repair photolyase